MGIACETTVLLVASFCVGGCCSRGDYSFETCASCACEATYPKQSVGVGWQQDQEREREREREREKKEFTRVAP